MRTIIAGSRDCTDYSQLLIALDNCGWEPTLVISGHARGADLLGEKWALEHGITLEVYPITGEAWTRNGKAAGPIRNHEMAINAEALIALWDGKSKGTKNMIDTAKRKKLMVYIHHTKD